MIAFLVLFYFLQAVAGFFFTNVAPDAQIDNSVIVGQFASISSNVRVNRNAQIGNFVFIAASTIIGENTKIGGYAGVGQRCVIANDVIINNFAKVGNDNTIGPGCILSGYTVTGDNVKFGNRVKVNQFAAIGDGAEISDDCFLDQYSVIGSNVKIAPQAYIGTFTSTGPSSNIGSLAVIHRFAEIPMGATIKDKAVVIPTPTSYELYQDCLGAENIQASQVEIAAKNTGSNAEFNSLLRGLIDSQLNNLKTSCEQTSASMRIENLPLINSLYLMRYHGLDRYKQNLQAVKEAPNNIRNIVMNNGQVYINGVRMNCTPHQQLKRQLENEYHFGENSGEEILEPDVLRNMIKLEVMAVDGERENRMEIDTVCSMIEQIINGEREITCAKRTAQMNSSINYC